MTGRGPLGPLIPLGRRGPLVTLGILLAVTGAGVAAILVVTRPDCRTDRFGPGSGDGRDPSRPLLVDSTAALTEAPRCHERHLRQVADLVAPNPWTPIGLGGAAGPTFTGSYDGGGHRLTGVRVFLPGSADVGVFGVLDGEVRDLVLEDLVVEAGDRTGAVAGRVGPDAIVRDVTVRGAAVRGGRDVGGLVGLAHPDAVVEGTFDGRIGDDAPRTVGRVGALTPTGSADGGAAPDPATASRTP